MIKLKQIIHYHNIYTTYTKHDILPSAPPLQFIETIPSAPLCNRYFFNEFQQIQAYSCASNQPVQSYQQENNRLQELEIFVNKHEISADFALKLRQLEGFDIVVIADDSGSMTTPVKNPTTKKFKDLSSRWQEMKEILLTIIELSMILDKNGVDIYFLNREPIYNVMSAEILDIVFTVNPYGYTPIVRTIQKVLAEKAQSLYEKKLLIIIATDGEPTDAFGKTEDSNHVSEINKLYNVLSNERKPANKIYTTMLACTDDYLTMNYFENWDKKLQNFDLVDDYHSEKNKNSESSGVKFQIFSR